MPCLIWVTAAAFWPISALLSFLSTDYGQCSHWVVLLYSHSDQVIPLLKILQWFPISLRLETKISSKTYKQQLICPSRHQFSDFIFTFSLPCCSLSSNCLSPWPPRSWSPDVHGLPAGHSSSLYSGTFSPSVSLSFLSLCLSPAHPRCWVPRTALSRLHSFSKWCLSANWRLDIRVEIEKRNFPSAPETCLQDGTHLEHLEGFERLNLLPSVGQVTLCQAPVSYTLVML